MTSAPTTSAAVFRFDVFEVDLRTDELRKAGKPVRLQEQPWQVLVALVENAGALVSRQQLRDRLWPADTFVDFDHSLNIAINKIRDVLGDAPASPRFVETVPKRGYRFIAPVERIVPEEASQAASPISPNPRSRIWRVAIAGVLLLFTGFAVVATRTRVASPSQRHVIAVLPFRNLSPDHETDYFADGLTDEVIYNLSIIEGLEVKSRGSSFHFKGATVDARDAGRQLNADLVLEGDVLRSATTLRLSVSLVRVSDDVALWSERYDRDVADVFGVEDELSRSIVNELRLNGVGGRRRYRPNIKAYDEYLRALSLSNENSPSYGSRLNQAIELFGQATIDDPQFAAAFAATAETWAHLRDRVARPRDINERMRGAAEKAIELDPLLAAARASLGLVHATDLRWAEAESDFQKALELDPNSALARSDFARFVLLPEQRTGEALAQLTKALELDPLSPSRQLQVANCHMRAGAYARALALAEPVFAGDPANEGAGQLVARALMLQGRVAEAVAIFETLSKASHGYLGYAYALQGRRGEAEAIASEPDIAADRHQLLVYAGLGDRDRSFAALRAMAQADDYSVDWFPGDPELAPMRDDPRMREFRRLRGLAAVR